MGTKDDQPGSAGNTRIPAHAPAGKARPEGPGAIGYRLYDPSRNDGRRGPGYCAWPGSGAPSKPR